MILELISIGVLLGQFIYYKWIDPKLGRDADALDLPKTTEGESPSLAFGRCRVNRPILAWQSAGRARSNPGGLDGDTFWQGAPFLYDWEALFVIAIPFFEGTQKIHSIYAGDVRLPDGDDADIIAAPGTYTPLSGLTGDGSFEGDVRPCFVWAHYSNAANNGSAFEIGGLVEFLNGKSTQDLLDGSLAPTTAAGQRMLDDGVAAAAISGFRGYLSLFLGEKTGSNQFGIGNTPHPPSLTFEVSTYPASDYFPGFFGPFKIDEDANPAHVIAALLCDQYGKHGQLAGDILHSSSFAKSATTLLNEGHGYSRCWDSRTTSRDMINDVLIQTDGVLYKDQASGLWHYDLIRPDYDPNLLRQLNPGNCRVDAGSFAAGGYIDTPNAIRVVFSDRADDYRENSATAQNQANAVGQGGEVIETVLRMLGITTADLAKEVAGRELGWRSKPTMKCRVFASREFEDVVEGTPLRLLYPDLNVADRVMRVAAVSFSTSDSNAVVLDLIEDAFYVFRKRVHHGDVTPHPTPPIFEH